MKKLILFAALLLVASSLFISSCGGETTITVTKTSEAGPSTETFTLKFAYWPPPPAPICRLGFEGWGPAVEDATDGRIKIEYIGGGALGAPPAHYDLVASGMADIGVMTPEFTPGTFPLSEIANLPALFPNSEVAAGAMYQYHQKYTVDGELKGVKILAVAPTAPHQLHTIDKHVKTLEDLKGMELACSSVAHADTIEALGAVASTMVEGELFTALERGMVDGRLHAWDSIVTHKTMEVTKYRTGNVNAPLNQMIIVMNWDTWNKLPADLQNILTGLSGLDLSRYCGIIYDRANLQMLEVAKAYDKAQGNPDIYWLPEDEQKRWQDAMEVVPTKWAEAMEAKGLPGKAALKDLRAFVEQYKKLYQ